MKRADLRRLHRDESGQVTAWFVAISIILFGLMALAIDLGFFFHARRVAQNAADPGALAGAAYLTGCPLSGQGDAVAVAQQYVDSNLTGKDFTKSDTVATPQIRSFTPPGGSVAFPSMYTFLTRQQNYILAQFLPGLSGKFVDIPAEAEAVCGPITSGGICPFYLPAPDPNASTPVYDGSGNLVSIYGINVGKVYSMKVSSGGSVTGNFQILDLVGGGGASAYKQFIASGCSNGNQPAVTEEGGDVSADTDPGNKSGPTQQSLEGGGGVTGLYQIEKQDLTNFPKGHLSCDLPVKPDPTDPTGNLYNIIDSSGNVIAPAQVTTMVNALTDPSKMGSPSSPCGGVLKNGSPYPALVFPAVQGRFMQIALTNGTGGGSDTIPVLGVLRLYIVCWGHQDTNNFPAGAKACDNSAATPNGQATIWGVFGSFSAPNLLISGGLGTDPLSPKHVVLVK